MTTKSATSNAALELRERLTQRHVSPAATISKHLKSGEKAMAPHGASPADVAPNATKAYAKFIVDTRFADLPEEVLPRLRLLLLDM